MNVKRLGRSEESQPRWVERSLKSPPKNPDRWWCGDATAEGHLGNSSPFQTTQAYTTGGANCFL